jgi:hypothetical protein
LRDGRLRVARYRQQHLCVGRDERPRPQGGEVDWKALTFYLPQSSPSTSTPP